jgi:HPt (histidine-containing phosphotransfer) domain-containing protein
MSFVMSTSGSPGAGTDTQPSILDEEHLGRMTLGDRGFEREVLEIFVRHSATTLDLILDCVVGQDPAAVVVAAHTMIGAARGIGAWRVALAAERVEHAAEAGGEQELDEAVAALKAASLEANAVIGARLAGPKNCTADCA